MMDYGVTFLHTPIFIDNSSAISIVNNPVKHSKTKHIEIRYHFIRDCNEKKLVQVVKVHTDNQFADLFTKAFDGIHSSTQFSLSFNEQEQPSSMASMAFIDEHNEIAMLQKPKQAAGFHQIVDFLKSSHIAHALTVAPTIYIEHQRHFWANATIVAENGVQMIKTRVCDQPLTVSEEVIRFSLRLDDASGITSIPNDELFSSLTRMGYGGPLGVFKFSKAKFSPQWRFLVHTLMHCISKKTTGWSEFSSPIAYALVCLATARRFVQEVITNELMDIPQPVGVYVPKPPKGKVFSNMRRSAGDSDGVDTPLFSTMMVVSQTTEGKEGSFPSCTITPKPLSPLKENSPLENIHRETTGVSPSPKEVLSEEEEEYMGDEAATTPASTEEKSGNINKTSPMATSNEQSFEGPWCQETKGVDSASARQKTSTTKRSNDPSKEGNTSREGEDSYNYYELMETMGNINMDVIKQGKDIEELKLIVLSQQEQIINLKQMVRKLIMQRKKKQFVLRRRKPVTDAPKKGESEAEAKAKGEQEEKHDVKGEKEQAAETEPAAETINTASSSKAAEMVNTADLKEVAETVKEVLTELEIAETLIKAKHDTPKVISKAKGVVIKERGDAAKNSNTEKVMGKEKGKAKLVESDQPMKRQKLIDSDEALARKIQLELEEAEFEQVSKDREIAKAMAAELNKAYQQSLATEQAKQKATFLNKPTEIKMAARKRQPSKTYLGAQERKKMITFLKGAVGVKVEMFSKMSFENLKKMYDAEMTKLQWDDTARVEMDKRMKESNDFLQKPFPDEQETPEKETIIGESVRSLKRTKMMARRKSTKKPRVSEGEAEKVAEEEVAPESSKQQEPSTKDDVSLYMVVMDKVPEPISAEPVGVKPPEVIHWDTLTVDGKEYIRLKRKDDKYEVFNTWVKIVRTCSRSDIEEMFEIGMKLYADQLKALGISLTKLVMEYLCMMFKPEEVDQVIRNVFQAVANWTLYETSGVYAVTLDRNHIEYFLVDRVYNHNRLKLHAMLKKKLGCIPDSEMAKYLIQRTIN
ncbi:hypothetical protein L6452_14980 [Arctium lappa]|uniref:Uncharacterized protein n=1 Tax=Arctium lappa TaxID=4217 RepID=A0ACB9CMI7_ARCLA|nr:hypothetical protein L6452_14980 [Arctium lappa]